MNMQIRRSEYGSMQEGSPLVSNPVCKDPEQTEKNSQRHRGWKIPQVIYLDDIQMSLEPEPEWQQVNDDTDCLVLAYKGIEQETMDAAKLRIKPGGHTPVQYVDNQESVYTEVPWKGRLVFLAVSPSGEFFVNFWNIGEKENADFCPQISKGWIMCWYALKTQAEKQDEHTYAYVMECEVPGFDENDLLTVDHRVTQFEGTDIPEAFWDVVEQLERGEEDCLRDYLPEETGS